MDSLALLSLVLCSILLFIVYAVSRSRKLPPGPWGLPLVGHLHLLVGKLPHEALHSISIKFGPIFRLRLGMIPTVVVSGADVAREVLTRHDVTFASRPYFIVGDYIEYGFLGIGSSSYGDYYRSLRKLCTMKLFTSQCIDSFAWLREKEVSHLSRVILGYHSRNEAVDLRKFLSVSSFNITTQIICGKKYLDYESNLSDPDALEFQNLIEQLVNLVFKPCLSNFVPWYLRWLDWQIPHYKRVQAKADKFIQNIVDEHKAMTRECEDFADMLLNHFGRGAEAEVYTKALLLDLLIGGTDTISVSSEWLLAALMHNPQVLKKVQEELDSVVGQSRTVRESDLPNLTYLHAVIRETMRLYPTVPFLGPRMASCDVKVGDYYIRKGTALLINAWALGTDASVWKDPRKFLPERFLESSIDLKGQNFELLPFGSGRRKCPGMALGLRSMEYLVANLIHSFNWELATPPSMEAVCNSGCVLKTPLRGRASPRLLRIITTRVADE